MLKITVRTHDCKVIKAAYITPSITLPKILQHAVEAFVLARKPEYLEIHYKWGLIRIMKYDATLAALECFGTLCDFATKPPLDLSCEESIPNHD